MNGWISEELSKIGTAEELRIRSVRRDGTLRSPTTIWVVRHGEDLYVLEHINANSEAHEDWPPRVRKVASDGMVTTLVTFAPGQSKPERK